MQFSDFGLFYVDEPYLKALNAADKNSQYSDDKDYGNKPFLGIVEHDVYKYLIPLSSGKPKHAGMDYVGRDYILIYETINISAKRSSDIVKFRRDAWLDKILSILNINQMIPVPDGLYYKIDVFSNSLIRKEYDFCFDYKEDIIIKANELYNTATNNKTLERCCDFNKLKKVCTKFSK